MPRNLDPNKPYFSIGAVAEILGITPRTLRIYEEKGLIFPSRSDTNRRLYSLKDIDLLAYIHYLTNVKKVNLAGVLEIQSLLMRIDEKSRNTLMQQIEQEIDELPQEKKKIFHEGQDELAQEVANSADTDFFIKEEISKMKDHSQNI